MVKADETERGVMSEQILDNYFAAMDRGDVQTIVSSFTPDATVTWETGGVRLTGADEIGAFFTEITSTADEMVHQITSLVVDTETRKCAAEVHFRTKRRDQATIDSTAVDVFDFAADGRFTCLRFWTADPIPPASAAANVTT